MGFFYAPILLYGPKDYFMGPTDYHKATINTHLGCTTPCRFMFFYHFSIILVF